MEEKLEKIISGIRFGLGSQGIWTPELEQILLDEIMAQINQNYLLDEVIEKMIKKGYGKNFMNGDLVVAMIKDVLEILENKETLRSQLFIGKVSEIIGVYKTIQLLKEVNNEIK